MSDTSHIHTDDIIVDADEHFIIDTVTRAISSESNKKLTLMQYDHNCERYTFDIDRLVDGHDLMNCDRVQIHYVNIASNRQKHPGLYLVEDLHVNSSDTNKLTFTWLISNNGTMHEGSLGFLVSFECTNGDKILYRWSTNSFNGIVITAGMDNDNTIVEMYVDELLTWENYMHTTFIPDLVDKCYIKREFATEEEIAAIFDISNPEGGAPITVIPYEEVTDEEIDALFNNTDTDDGQVDPIPTPPTE